MENKYQDGRWKQNIANNIKCKQWKHSNWKADIVRLDFLKSKPQQYTIRNLFKYKGIE